MPTSNAAVGGSIKKGDVRAVRELSTGVQAQVCLGADVTHGYATITVVTNTPEVAAAMLALKDAVRRAATEYVADVLNGHAAWEQGR